MALISEPGALVPKCLEVVLRLQCSGLESSACLTELALEGVRETLGSEWRELAGPHAPLPQPRDTEKETTPGSHEIFLFGGICWFVVRKRTALESCSPLFPKQVGSVFSPRLGGHHPSGAAWEHQTYCALTFAFLGAAPSAWKAILKVLAELPPTDQSSKLACSEKASLHLPHRPLFSKNKAPVLTPVTPL